MVEPVHPFQRGHFNRFLGFPRPTAMDELSLVQPVDGLGQGVVVAVAPATYRRFDARLSQTFGVADGDILRASVAVMNESILTFRLAFVQRLLQCIEEKSVCIERLTCQPTIRR